MSDTIKSNGHPPTLNSHGFPALILKLAGSSAMHGGDMPGGVVRLIDSHSSIYLIPIDGSGKAFCLIDAGMDPKAEEILAVLRFKGLDPGMIKAIFVTHGHSDHTAGLRQFPDADVYVGQQDRAFIEGTAAGDGLFPRLLGKQPKLAVANSSKLHSVQDGEIVTVGDLQVRAFATPGHTHGSVVYLIGDTLYVGDSLYYNRTGKALMSPPPVSFNLAMARQSIASLVDRFDKENISVASVVPSHSGAGSFEALRRFSSKN